MRQLLPGEVKAKCKCGIVFIVQTWKLGKEREQCTTCKVAWKTVYRLLEEQPGMTQKAMKDLHMATIDELFEKVRYHKQRVKK